MSTQKHQGAGGKKRCLGRALGCAEDAGRCSGCVQGKMGFIMVHEARGDWQIVKEKEKTTMLRTGRGRSMGSAELVEIRMGSNFCESGGGSTRTRARC